MRPGKHADVGEYQATYKISRPRKRGRRGLRFGTHGPSGEEAESKQISVYCGKAGSASIELQYNIFF